jgi:4-hydroxy-2-oxoglutarate aldolase
MTERSFTGVFPPIPTPFDAEGALDSQALTRNLQRWNDSGLAGYVVLGSNGEAVTLTPEERVRVLSAARVAIPVDRVLIAGTGCESTRRTIALTQQAAGAGADAALVVTPNYYDPMMTPACLLHHYEAVADAAPIPVLLYHVPKFTHVTFPVETVARAAQHPNIVGIKDSSGDIARLADLVRETPPDFAVLAGSASFFFAGLTLGAVGGVLALANVAPRRCVEIFTLFREGQWDAAADLQRRMLPVNRAVTARFGIPGLKAALDLLGYVGGEVRAPLLPLPEDDRAALRQVLVEAGLLA